MVTIQPKQAANAAGAINAAPSLKEGVTRLEKLWFTLAQTPPLTPNFPAYLAMLAAVGLQFTALGSITRIIASAKHFGISPPASFDVLEQGFLSDSPLHHLMQEYFDPQALSGGLPLYVSVFKNSNSSKSVLQCLSAEAGLEDSPASDFLHIQSLPQEEQKEALMASAALPLLFAPRKVNNTMYSDGGMGGWQKAQGNTPITPLLEAGYSTIIVTHLVDGALWSRHDFPQATILEIRPQSSIARTGGVVGGVVDMLGFDANKIPSWIEQGYKDSLHCVGRVMDASRARSQLRASEAAVVASTAQFASADTRLAAAMARLRAVD